MSPKHLIVSSINHHHTPQEQRGFWAWSNTQQQTILQKLIHTESINEVVILCTCNRTEIICLTSNIESTKKHLDRLIPPPHRFFKQNQSAITHILRTLCGLESQCIGENEILGQYRQARQNTYASKGSHKSLLKILHQLHHMANKIREESGMNQHPTCLAKHVIIAIEQHLNHLISPNILFIGAGDTIQQHLKHLQRKKIKFNGTLACRYPEKNEHIAEKYQLKLAQIDQIKHLLQDNDCVIAATKCPTPIIDHQNLKHITRAPQLMVDLAVPRDIRWSNSDKNRVLTLDDLNQARQIPQAIINRANTLSQQNAILCYQAFVISQHSHHIQTFRKAWLDLCHQIMQKPVPKHKITQLLYWHMCTVHKLLGLPQPIEPQITCKDSLQRYANHLAHQPTVRLKKVIEKPIYQQKLRAAIRYFQQYAPQLTTPEPQPHSAQKTKAVNKSRRYRD